MSSITLTHYDDVQLFYDKIALFLLQQEAHNNLILSLTRGIINGMTYEEVPYMMVISDEQDIVLVCLRTPPHRVLLAGQIRQEALRLLVEDIRLRYDSVPGGQGYKPLVAAFADTWSDIIGQSYERTMEQCIYQLTTVMPPGNIPNGYMRLASPEDRQQLISWADHFNKEALNIQDRKWAEKTIDLYLKREVEGRRLFVWEDQGRNVSMAGMGGITENGARVSLVYTPPAYRGRGYASACVAALSQQILDEGRRFCFLYTDLHNPTSNHIYQKIGYYPVCQEDVYDFK